ncbi:MAG: glycoside hydrolase family 31 protein [Bacteroidetes bacterium]|nr:glycoside hydrolase family 31 protein [Bacteroidota bacterium]
MRRFLFLLLIFSGLSTFGQADRITESGKLTSLIKTANGVEISAEGAKIILTSYSPTIVRVRIVQHLFRDDFSYAVIQKSSPAFNSVSESKDSWILSTDSLNVYIQKNPFRIRFANHQGTSICEDYQDFGVTWQGTEVTCYKKLFPDEKFIGLGEKTGPLDRRGEKYENWNSDIPDYSVIQDPLYVTIPFYMGIHDHITYGIFFDNSFRSRFNFGASTDDLFSSFSASDGEMNYYFFGSSTVANIIKDYTWLTGRMKLPPYWSLGYQQCRWGYYPESEVMSLAQKFRDKKIPCDVIYFDIDYMDSYKIFTWHKIRFPQPKSMIDALKNKGFHVVTIVDPGIKIEKGYSSYEDGITNDYFAKYPDGKLYVGRVWPGRCHFPDFTKESTRKWWGNSFAALIDPGVEGFWNDMNEPSAWGQSIPAIVQFDFDGHHGSMAEAHNIYGLNMSRATFEGTKSLLGGKRPFVLTRAAYAGIQRYSAVWTGDNDASDEHMLLSARLVNSMGLSGIAFTGPDMGGFIGIPSKELFTRWLSLGVYTPFLRNHAVVDSKDKEPWSFGEETERIAIELLNQRYQLLPYIYSAFYEATQSGMPVARSLAIANTFDEKIYWRTYQNEYMFGDNLLIAPVTSDQQFAKVYLPEGEWYRLSSNAKYQGNTEVIVEAPLNDLPVFVKASGIIPMQSVIEYTAQKPSVALELHIYNGKTPSSFTFYEDDGTTYSYENGSYYKRMIIFDPRTKTITLAKSEGSFDSKFSAIHLILHDFSEMGIKVDEKDYTLKMKSKTEKMVEFPLSLDRVEIRY